MPSLESFNRVTTQHFYFQRIDDSEALQQSYALRYQVYCHERGFLSPDHYPDGMETDRFDSESLHFGAFNWEGQMVGTVRLVSPARRDFPLLDHCFVDPAILPPVLFAELQTEPVAEISRLAVSKLYRRRAGDGLYGLAVVEDNDAIGRRQRPEIVLGLYKVMYQESKRQGIRFWYAAMESSLWRLLARFAFEFRTIGPEVDYYGPVTPYLADISEIERLVYQRRPEIFREFTEGLEARLLPAFTRAG